MPEAMLVLSNSDIAVLRDIIAKVRRAPGPRGGDQVDTFEIDTFTPEVYLAQAPTGGLPASSGGVLGVADCQIYRVVPGGGTTQALGYTKTVYNPTSSAISAGTQFPITKDKFGSWHSLPSGGSSAPVFNSAKVFGPGSSVVVANLTYTDILWSKTAPSWDTDGYWTYGNGNGAQLVVQHDGYYLIQASGSWSQPANQSPGVTRRLQLIQTDASLSEMIQSHPLPANSYPITTGWDVSQQITALWHLTTGQWTKLQAYHDAGVSLSFFGSTFSITKIG